MCWAGSIVLLLAAGFAGTARAEITRAADGTPIAATDLETALATDTVVAALAPGEQVRIADLVLTADAPSRAMISLSSEFLTVAVTSGRLRLGDSRAARAGHALLATLDGNKVQRLAYDGGQLAASLSPGARPVLATDLEAVVRAQRRAAFWGTYEPLRINARAPSSPAIEDVRQSYLSAPAILRQRRSMVGEASAAARGRQAVDAFLASYAAGDAAGVGALLDPEPFLVSGGAAGLPEARTGAGRTLIADTRLRPVLAAPASIAMEADGSAALLDGAGGRWRLSLVARDRAVFIRALEPAQ